MTNTLVLVHGYSDKGKSFAKWKKLLQDRYDNVEQICTCDYESLTNEVTIKDIAEGFDRALSLTAGLSKDEDFDAIVHSTGMLVIRAWLTTYRHRRDRLKHLIGLAPATFGSPLARKGRSWLGAVFKGNKDWGPDFLEAGDLILDALELASPYTWALAQKDIFGPVPFYDNQAATPYVHIFCGTEGYGGLLKVVDTPGSDGTVRQAGAGFNVRHITIDLTKQQTILDPDNEGNRKRWDIKDWKNASIPVHLVKGLNHGTILSHPTDELVQLVRSALDVNDPASFHDWLGKANAAKRMDEMPQQWQQFIVRALDERHDPIPDYNLQLYADGGKTRVEAFDQHVDAYTNDKSYRCFLVDLVAVQGIKDLQLRIIASSGSQYVDYEGHNAESNTKTKKKPVTSQRGWDAQLDLSGLLDDQNEATRFLSPFTTTLVDLHLDREPVPLDPQKMSDLVQMRAG